LNNVGNNDTKKIVILKLGMTANSWDKRAGTLYFCNPEIYRCFFLQFTDNAGLF